MQDVIFSGTENRRPLSYASVAITLDNADHQLPVDYKEVTVTRKLYRSGESEYLMLRLRLTEGVTEAGFAARFGHPLPQLWRERAAKLPAELIVSDGGGIRLTRSGFLLSNVLIGKVLGF